MFRTIRALLQEASAYVTFWPLVGGSALMGGLGAWAAHATTLLAPYAPFSWFASALVGALAFMAVLLAGAAFRNWIITGNVRRRFYESRPQAINPLDQTFERRRIAIHDITPPFGVVVEGKTFLDCELIGPANIAMSGCTVQGCQYTIVDSVLVSDTAQLQNGLLFRNCTFLNCHFFRVSIFVPQRARAEFEQGTQGIVWINP